MTSKFSLVLFSTCNTNFTEQTGHTSDVSIHVHSKGKLNESTVLEQSGIRPNLCDKNSSCKGDVFSLILTNSIAIVGTSAMIILLNALAYAVETFLRRNRI